MRGLLNRLNNSTRNSAVYRSVNLNVLNTEKSTFLKPESRKRFLLMLPYVPALGGTITELPETKHPPVASVVGSGATAVHLAPSDAGSVAVRPLIADVVVHVAGPGKPVQYGIELEPDLKSAGFPKKSQRSVCSPVPMKSFPVSSTSHGWLLSRFMVVLSFQPLSS